MTAPYSFIQIEEAYRAISRHKALDIIPELMLLSNRVAYGGVSAIQIIQGLDHIIRHHLEQHQEKLADKY